jgi:hypothetical protein
MFRANFKGTSGDHNREIVVRGSLYCKKDNTKLKKTTLQRASQSGTIEKLSKKDLSADDTAPRCGEMCSQEASSQTWETDINNSMM